MIISLARQGRLAVAREDLTGLVESLTRLPKDHRTALIALGYRRLAFWVDWQAEKNGVPLFVVDPADTSSTCPRCGAGLIEVGYRRLRCPRCGLEGDRDTIAILNIEGRALSKIGGALATLTAPSGLRAGKVVYHPVGYEEQNARYNVSEYQGHYGPAKRVERLQGSDVTVLRRQVHIRGAAYH